MSTTGWRAHGIPPEPREWPSDVEPQNEPRMCARGQRHPLQPGTCIISFFPPLSSPRPPVPRAQTLGCPRTWFSKLVTGGEWCNLNPHGSVYLFICKCNDSLCPSGVRTQSTIKLEHPIRWIPPYALKDVVPFCLNYFFNVQGF